MTVFGGTEVDFRGAQLVESDTTVVALSIFGGTKLRVPAGVRVDLEAHTIFGGNTETGSRGDPFPGAPVLRVVAVPIFGGVELEHLPAAGALPPGARPELGEA